MGGGERGVPNVSAPIPDAWLQAAFDAIATCQWPDAEPRIRAVLSAVLPLHEQQIREQFALDLESVSNRYDQDADIRTGEPRAVLRAKAEVLWEAAVRIRTATDEGARS